MIIALLSSVVLAGCSTTSSKNQDTDKKTKGNTVKIGMVTPLSGPASTYGQDYANTVKLATAAHNAAHPDHQIEIVIEDGKCNGSDATSAAQKLITIDNVVALLWGGCSSEAVAVGKVAQTAKVTSLVPYPQSPNISKIGNYIFRFANGLQGGRMIADKVSGFKNIMLVSEKTEYAQSLATVLKEEAAEKISYELAYETSEKDFDLIAKRVQDNLEGVEAIVFFTQSEATTSNLIKAFDKAGIQANFKGKLIAFPFFSSKAFINNVGPKLATNLYNINFGPDMSQGEAKEVMERFIKQYPVKALDVVVTLGTEGINLFGEAIVNGNTSRESIHAYIAWLSEEKPRNGLFGPYYFSGSDAQGVPYFMEKVDNGVVKIVKDFE